MTRIQELILKEAIKDLGKKEIKGNSGWQDPEFQIEMEMTGWSPGQAWCAYWFEKIWTNAYVHHNSLMVNVLRKLFSANAVATWENFSKSKFTTSQVATPGAGIIWMNMKNNQPNYVGSTKWIKGHAGIVREVFPGENKFKTFEGNSNDDGGREGIEVASLLRTYDFNKENGLRLLGFIHPIE